MTRGVGTAVLFASFFLGYALAFWYGTKLVADDIEAGCESDCATGVRKGKKLHLLTCLLVAKCVYTFTLPPPHHSRTLTRA